jgi:hypothetical protein
MEDSVVPTVIGILGGGDNSMGQFLDWQTNYVNKKLDLKLIFKMKTFKHLLCGYFREKMLTIMPRLPVVTTIDNFF